MCYTHTHINVNICMCNRVNVKGLWRGNTIAVLRIAPFSAISYTTFYMYEKGIQQRFRTDKDVLSRFCAGAAAGGTTCHLYIYIYDTNTPKLSY